MFKDKKILVTGGTGSIGSEIVRSLIPHNPGVIRVLSNDEDALFHLQQEIGWGPCRYIIGDVRDRRVMMRAMEDVDIVYHAAALKHVPLCEYNTFEAVKTNVLGTQHVIEAAFCNDVDRVVNISTDKAVNPVNAMGATKLLTEKLVCNANDGKGLKRTVFASVRFGNVLNSRGSVVPVWEEQIRRGVPVTVTDPDMTRFMMSVDDAVKLVFKATVLMKGGEVFILKMPVVRLGDLFERVLAGRRVETRVVGLRPGERRHECLMTEEERLVAVELDDMFVVPFLKERLK